MKYRESDRTSDRTSNPESVSRAWAQSRRSFLKNASIVAAGAGLLPWARPAWAAADAFPIAKTAQGVLRGLDIAGIKTFRGIRYGASTAGKNRFMPPAPPPTWKGVRDAYAFGEISPQAIADPRSEYVQMILWDRHRGGMGEDCLVLNVWTPGLKDGARRPVLVSLHGGGFATGSGDLPGYDGDLLARFGDVVVVTVNHRIGALGYLQLADLGGPAELAESGAAGMLDLVAALRWVRENIESFGGDPGNVMIFGQSGGGSKTSTLLAMPGAKGLFQRAAVQSGSRLRLTERDDAARTAQRLLAELGIPKGKLADLQKLPFEAILSAQIALAGQRPPAEFAPVVGNQAIPRHPFDPTAPEVSADVPMIIGTTLDDSADRTGGFDLDEAGLRSFVEQLVGGKADQVLGVYRRAYPDARPYFIQARIRTDRDQRVRANAQAERKAALGKAPAYLYLFTWPSPGFGGKFGAVHGTDVGLVFHNPRDPINGNTPEARALADKMASAWVAFAKTGDPNTSQLPKWPAYTAEKRDTMIFDNECRVQGDPLREMRLLWTELAG